MTPRQTAAFRPTQPQRAVVAQQLRRTWWWRLLARSERLKAVRRWGLKVVRRTRRRLRRMVGRDDELGEGSVLYLTFDDGPDPVSTPRILDTLARHDARAVFFAVGSRGRQHTELLARIVAEGHGLGNHTWGHRRLTGLDRQSYDREVLTAQEVFATASGRRPSALRPPHGAMDAHTRPWARAAGLEVFLWDVDPRDWADPGVERIVDDIEREARSGDVVLLHDGGERQQTIEALGILLERLSARGVRFPVLPGC